MQQVQMLNLQDVRLKIRYKLNTYKPSHTQVLLRPDIYQIPSPLVSQRSLR